jgi:predicted transcriptional regulator YdeE
MYGVPPGKYRNRTAKEKVQVTVQPAVEPRFGTPFELTLPPRRLAGRRVTITGLTDITPGTAWTRLEPDFPVAGAVSGMSYGICFGEASHGEYDYMADIELQPGARVPTGLDLLELPADRYFVVRQLMPADGFAAHLKAGLQQLWGRMLTEAGKEPSAGPDFEGYPDDLIAGRTEGWLTHMVPIKA